MMTALKKNFARWCGEKTASETSYYEPTPENLSSHHARVPKMTKLDFFSSLLLCSPSFSLFFSVNQFRVACFPPFLQPSRSIPFISQLFLLGVANLTKKWLLAVLRCKYIQFYCKMFYHFLDFKMFLHDCMIASLLWLFANCVRLTYISKTNTYVNMMIIM